MAGSPIHPRTTTTENDNSASTMKGVPEDLARSLITQPIAVNQNTTPYITSNPPHMLQTSPLSFTSSMATIPNPSTQNIFITQKPSFTPNPPFIAQRSLGNPPMFAFDAPPVVTQPHHPRGHKNFRVAHLEKSLVEMKRAHGVANISCAQDLWERFVKVKEIAEKMVEENKMERESLEKIFGDMKQVSKKKLKKLGASVVNLELDLNDSSFSD